MFIGEKIETNKYILILASICVAKSATRTRDVPVGKYPRIHSYSWPAGFPTDMPVGTHGSFVLVSCLNKNPFDAAEKEGERK